MAPVYYDTYYNEQLGMDEIRQIEDSDDISTGALSDSSSGTIYSQYALNYGFSDAIMNYFDENGMTDWQTRYNFLMSDELERKYTMRYTLSDNGANYIKIK
jgi:hypothetical protein